ncbi:hypothetical protein COCCU_02915 [Corynebacterium occultum]|uniref:Major facilitator superfamily (MFS) profile domain-containing protein n=1 Tax=Corynebacterium occultum TaxID=2675219 RepID=A0A6B8W3P3_9CORY|nr:hypothetical protein [Corynebacterium occultum]QGU06537.1 hypothetical protein COCCU_02915 [Corynebacterium occultum]
MSALISLVLGGIILALGIWLVAGVGASVMAIIGALIIAVGGALIGTAMALAFDKINPTSRKLGR